jgi:hypothetical protein
VATVLAAMPTGTTIESAAHVVIHTTMIVPGTGHLRAVVHHQWTTILLRHAAATRTRTVVITHRTRMPMAGRTIVRMTARRHQGTLCLRVMAATQEKADIRGTMSAATSEHYTYSSSYIGNV